MNNTTNLKNQNLKFGLLAGFLTTFYLSIFYTIDKALFFSPLVFWSSFAIYIFFMVKAWKVSENPQDFRAGIKTMFVVYVIANVIYYIFFYVLVNFVDPSLIDTQRELMLAKGVDLEGVDLAMTLTRALFDFCWGCIGGFILSAITSFFATRFG